MKHFTKLHSSSISDSEKIERKRRKLTNDNYDCSESGFPDFGVQVFLTDPANEMLLKKDW